MSSENKSAVHHLPMGTVLNGKYIIEETLGEGGFGITYKGHDKLLGLPAAIKEYFPNGYAVRYSESSLDVTLTSEGNAEYFNQWKEKFLNEARMLASLNDISGIVNVRDYFEENGTAYIVMEYLKGKTLKQIVQSEGAMDPVRITGLMLPLIKSLQRVHEQGLIHRDISHDNIMLMPDGKLKLFDFGAARDYSGQQHSYSIMLKPGFAPQEQYRTRGMQGPWTDIYALCATMYYCITGKVPEDSMERTFNDELKPPSELGVKIPGNIEDAIMKGLRIKETERFQTADELFEALAHRPGKNVIRIATPAPDGGAVADAVPADGGVHTTVMIKNDDTKKTTVMNADNSAGTARTEIMPSNKPQHTMKMPSEKPAAANRTEIFQQTPAAENKAAKPQPNEKVKPEKNVVDLTADPVTHEHKDTPLPAKTESGDKPQKKGLPKFGKFFIGIGAALCVLIVTAVVIFSNMTAGETLVRLSDKTVTVDEIKTLAGKSTYSISLTNCRLDDGVLAELGRTNMPILNEFSAVGCSGDLNFAEIDFSKYNKLHYLKLIDCVGAGNIFAGSGKITDYISKLELSGTDIDITMLDKLSSVNTLAITSDSFDGVEEKIAGLENVSRLMLKGYSTKPELTATQISGIFNARYYSMLRLENLTLSDEAQEMVRSQLSGQNYLELLSLNGCGLNSINIVSECSALKVLIADNNSITDLDPLKRLIYLEEISFNGNDIKDISGLSNCTQLKKVLLRDNNITNAEVLDKSAETLMSVDLSGNSGLAGRLGSVSAWEKLEALNISDTGIFGDELTLHGTKLLSLIAPNCGLSKIEFLNSPGLLRFIDVSGNKLSDASLFVDVGYDVSSYTTVIACDNEFTDLSGITYRSGLSTKNNLNLFLNGNDISKLPVYVDRIAHFYFDYNSQYEEQELSDMKYMAEHSDWNITFVVNNMPLDKRVMFEQSLQSHCFITFDEERTESDSMAEANVASAEADDLYQIDNIFSVSA